MRYWILAVVLGLMLSFAAACGGDDDGDGEDTTSGSDSPTQVAESSPSDQETEQEEPTATSESEPSPTPEPDPTPSPAPGSENEGSNATGELEGLLLTVEDMPEGWVEGADTEVDAETDMELGDVDDQPFEAPCGVQPLEETFEPQAEASRTFQGSELGPFFSHSVAQLESTDQAEQVMGQLREIFGCEEWVETDDLGDEVIFEITEMPVDSIGDDVYAVELSMSFADANEMESQMFGDFGFNMAFMRTGEYLNMFAFIDIFGMSEVDFQGLMQQAEEKIQANT